MSTKKKAFSSLVSSRIMTDELASSADGYLSPSLVHGVLESYAMTDLAAIVDSLLRLAKLRCLPGEITRAEAIFHLTQLACVDVDCINQMRRQLTIDIQTGALVRPERPISPETLQLFLNRLAAFVSLASRAEVLAVQLGAYALEVSHG